MLKTVQAVRSAGRMKRPLVAYFQERLDLRDPRSHHTILVDVATVEIDLLDFVAQEAAGP